MTRTPTLGKLDGGGPATLNLEVLLGSRLAVSANSGAGKSWLLRRLLEQTHGQVQQLVIDQEGEFHTLRERYDYVLAAPKDGDCLAEPRTAKLLARRLLELNVSAIIDIYELRAHERIRFVRLFLEALINAPRKLWHPVLVIVDEASVLCPQQGKAESAGAVIDLMTRGRKRGFAGILATQRISKLNKDALAECNNKLIGRSSLDLDMKRAADELGFSTREQQHSLRHLKPGHFFAFGPALSPQVVGVQIGPVRTTHPHAGQSALTPTAPSAAIRATLARLADLPQEAEQEAQTIDALKRRVAALERERRAHSAPVAPAVDVDAIRGEAHRKGYSEGVTAVKAAFESQAADAAASLGTAATAIADATGKMRSKIEPGPAPKIAREAPRPAPARARPAGDGITIAKPQQRVLDAIAWFGSIGIEEPTRGQVAFKARYSPQSGGFANLLGGLRGQELIDYGRPGAVSLTADGRDRAEHPMSPATTEKLQEIILEEISGPAAEILRVLINAYPSDLGREQVADKVGKSATSGGYANLLGRLRSLQLIEYPSRGRLMAQSILFLDQRQELDPRAG